MEKAVKNKFFKYIYIFLFINLFSIGAMIPSVYFFVIDYADYVTRTDSIFWMGYLFIVLMIITIMIFIISFGFIWKLVYDYLWRKREDRVEAENVKN